MKIRVKKRKCFAENAYLCTVKRKTIMEEKKFKNRTEKLEWLDAQKGWGPLTEEEKAILDDAVRMVTNLDSKPRYAISY